MEDGRLACPRDHRFNPSAPGVAQSSHRAARSLDHYGKCTQPEFPQICARSKYLSYHDGVPFSGATVDAERHDFESREERAQHSRYISVGPETRAPRYIALEGAVSQLSDRIQHANRNLGQLVEMLATDQESNRLTLEHLSILLAELLGVGETVQREGVPENDPELAMALHQYRQHLERLRELLPSLQACLLTERARLEAERSHLEAAYAWGESSKYSP